ncbi:MAG: TVP38/TMEM64 family protein [Coxiellaceae bacterium]|nr:TVP38/TMEM64 family protein [Coxiellaceae bacterium]
MKKWIPLLIIIVILALALYFRWYEYFSFNSLQQHRGQISSWVEHHYIYAALGYMLVYIVATAISVPGAAFITLAGGFMFGPWLATVYVVISATIGACIIFLAVKTALGEWLSQKAGGWVVKMEKGFQHDAFAYLLSLRLIPIFPFWVINIVPALLNVPLRTFFFATLIGIIPGSFVYCLVGNGLGALFKTGEHPNLGIIFQPEILIPLILLALLSVVPVIYKKLKRKKLDSNSRAE